MVDMRPEQSDCPAGRPALWQRKRVGSIALAAVGLLATLRLRGSCETALSIGLELAVQLSLIGSWWIVSRRYTHIVRSSAQADAQRCLMRFGLALAVAPAIMQVVLRWLGQGTGLELVAMSCFGWPNLLAAIGAQQRRTLGTVVVCSGFLTLLVTCSSDHSVALLLALLWGGLCLWWLASSTWERAQRCQVNTVVANRWQRPVTVLVGCSVFALSAWSVAGRFPPAQRLSWEIAPTSGGTSVNDEFARSGVGDGDALVAARENAASFGAVDSDLMLDSKEASLFDLYSDTFGEPVRKPEVERSVALSQQQEDIPQPNNMAQSDGASSSLTTQRRPGKASKALSNRASDALLFWIGRPDSHLALERFSHFDGIQWQAAPPIANSDTSRLRALQPTPSGNHTWFSLRSNALQATTPTSLFQGACAEAVKYARLKSPRIPAVAGMHSWHIKQVDDASFFQIDENDNLSMPGRKSVPEYTIVRYINREIDMQSLVEKSRIPFRASETMALDGNADESPTQKVKLTSGQCLAGETVRKWNAETASATNFRLPDSARRVLEPTHGSQWAAVTQVIDRLRQQYRLDRSMDTSSMTDPLSEFLQQRAGNDLMFATAAAVMLRELGYETRLVTGFIARSENRLGWTKELAVYAQDTHAWLEVQFGENNWIPLEPSPGYPQPNYRVSWSFWLRLHAWRMALGLATAAVATALAYYFRAVLFDCLCRAMSLLCLIGSDRQRCRWLLVILDWRSRLVGHDRPRHVTPERWYAVLAGADLPSVSQSTQIFFREADRLWFGNQARLSEAGRRACMTLWNQSTCRTLRQAMSSSRKMST